MYLANMYHALYLYNVCAFIHMYIYSEEATQQINVTVKMRVRQIDKRMRFLVNLNVG